MLLLLWLMSTVSVYDDGPMTTSAVLTRLIVLCVIVRSPAQMRRHGGGVRALRAKITGEAIGRALDKLQPAATRVTVALEATQDIHHCGRTKGERGHWRGFLPYQSAAGRRRLTGKFLFSVGRRSHGRRRIFSPM